MHHKSQRRARSRGGQATPSESAAGATAPKDQLVARLRKSFETCREVVSKLTESALADSVPFFGGRRTTKAVAAMYLVTDWADTTRRPRCTSGFKEMLTPV